jgi:hypothetical protein
VLAGDKKRHLPVILVCHFMTCCLLFKQVTLLRKIKRHEGFSFTARKFLKVDHWIVKAVARMFVLCVQWEQGMLRVDLRVSFLRFPPSIFIRVEMVAPRVCEAPGRNPCCVDTAT